MRGGWGGASGNFQTKCPNRIKVDAVGWYTKITGNTGTPLHQNAYLSFFTIVLLSLNRLPQGFYYLLHNLHICWIRRVCVYVERVSTFNPKIGTLLLSKSSKVGTPPFGSRCGVWASSEARTS